MLLLCVIRFTHIVILSLYSVPWKDSKFKPFLYCSLCNFLSYLVQIRWPKTCYWCMCNFNCIYSSKLFLSSDWRRHSLQMPRIFSCWKPYNTGCQYPRVQIIAMCFSILQRLLPLAFQYIDVSFMLYCVHSVCVLTIPSLDVIDKIHEINTSAGQVVFCFYCFLVSRWRFLK